MNASWRWALRTSSPAETSDLWFLFSVTEVAAYLGWCCSCQSWSYTPGSYLHAVFGNAMTAALGSIHNRTSVYLVLQTCSAVKPNAKKVLQVYQRKTLYVSLISGPCTFSKVFSVVKNIEKSTCTLVSYSLVRALKLFARKKSLFLLFESKNIQLYVTWWPWCNRCLLYIICRVTLFQVRAEQFCSSMFWKEMFSMEVLPQNMRK